MSKVPRSAAMRTAVSRTTLTRSGPWIGWRWKLGARRTDVLSEVCRVRRRQARQQRPSMRQFARRNAGRRHGRHEGHRNAVLEQDGRFVAVERPVDDVGEAAAASVTDIDRVGLDMRMV